MLEDNKALVRRFVDEFQVAGKTEAADELVAAEATHHSGPAWAREATAGAERARQVMAGLRAAFGDLHAVIHDQIAEDDKVVRAARPGTTLAVIEGPLPSRPSPSWMHLMNLLMLVELNGRERTIEDYASLLGQAGYHLDRVIPAVGTGWGYPWTVLEAIRQ